MFLYDEIHGKKINYYLDMIFRIIYSAIFIKNYFQVYLSSDQDFFHLGFGMLSVGSNLALKTCSYFFSGFFVIFLLELLAFRVVSFGIFMCCYSDIRDSFFGPG